ncbi:hypothetical protein FRC12_002409 [Ceratobasidium sp. 428]|nr:hypothetical protein FRC12_002409 [Ceratobasidium sp. 428]
MGLDLAIFLSGYASTAIFDGNPLALQWSIGGAAEPLLLVPQGLGCSHNKFEGDASPTRSDAFLNRGDVSALNLTFKQLCDLELEGPGANFDYDTLIKHRASRRQDSISNNPNFFYEPFTGVVALPAAYAFINRYMSNHSAEAPEGTLNHDVLMSFYGVSGDSSNLTYQLGHERIPENWYRRKSTYGLVPYFADIAYAGIQHPEFLSIGGNTGTVNSFAGVDLGNLTGGVHNVKNLLEGDNLSCFAQAFSFQAAQQLMPDVLKAVLSGLASNLGLLDSDIPALSGAGCPKLAKFNQSVLAIFPGAG